MYPRKLTLRREELYEKVWTTPLQKLAREFGLSDVGLAKLCRRHGIPRPGRGYWTRVEFGQNPGRIPLPALDKPGSDIIEITIRERAFNEAGQSPNPDAAQAANAIKIVVSEDEPISHPLAIRTQRMLAHARKDERGILFLKERCASHIEVSETALPRALRILDALFRAMHECNLTLKWPKEETSRLSVTVLEEELQFEISEEVEAKPHTLTAEEIARQKRGLWVHLPQWDHTATGRLRLAIAGVPYGIRHTWGDGKRQRLEDCLGKFIASLPVAAQAFKKEREERERRQREWEERRKREEEARQHRAEHARKVEVLSKFARAWHEAKLIRDFVDAFKKACEQLSKTEAGKRETEFFVEWATEYADSVDPISSVTAAIRQLRNPPKGYSF